MMKKIKYATFSQIAFQKVYQGTPEVGIALRQQFYPLPGVVVGQEVYLREPTKGGDGGTEYSANAVAWGRLPKGRAI